MSRRSKHLYEFGPFRLDVAEHLLLRDGEAVALPPKAFDLLQVLIEHHGHLLEKDELLKAVWPGVFVEEVNLSYNVSLIRKALGEGENGQRFIETIPKRGYRFVGDVREMEESALPTLEESPGLQDFNKDAGQPAGSDLETKPEEHPLLAEDVAIPLAQFAEASDQALASLATGSERAKRRERLAWIVSALFALMALISIIGYFRKAPVEVRSYRSFIPSPQLHFAGNDPGSFVVSPDGRHLAFVASKPEGKNLVWVRPLNALTAQPLEDTEGATYPFWSPDSQWIGFFVGPMLKKTKVSGGPVLKICDLTSDGNSGTWSRDDVILYSTYYYGPLYQVSASGGVPKAATILGGSPLEVNHRFPHFLPDGRHFLYLATSGEPGREREAVGIYLASFDDQERKLLLPDYSNIAYGSGYLLFGRDRALVAQPFDTGRLELTGDAFPIADNVGFYNPGRPAFSVSENGVLVFQAGAAVTGSRLVWFDRNGKQLGMLGDQAYYRDTDLSSDGRKVAVDIRDLKLQKQDIWIYDTARGFKTRFTLDSAPGSVPLWSFDGSRIVYCSNRKGIFDLYQRASNGAGTEDVLLESNLTKYPTSWSRDGRFIIYYTSGDPKTRADLWVLPMFGERKPFPFLQTEANEFKGRFSPDGRWIAYVSDESREREVYVRPFPGPGGKHQVSIAGGSELRWRGDGKELFYLAADNKLMAAEVKIKGSTLEIGAVRPLFETHPTHQGRLNVTADGQRFLVNTLVEEKGSSPITLVVNWTADLKR
ncbi:MAG: winged helix-turn-helix domain-containing protein [Acidobacteria bacterium]|nr:winged helix-turn-helix domain-containing protein [Acidobacteriota bacterium]